MSKELNPVIEGDMSPYEDMFRISWNVDTQRYSFRHFDVKHGPFRTIEEVAAEIVKLEHKEMDGEGERD